MLLNTKFIWWVNVPFLIINLAFSLRLHRTLYLLPLTVFALLLTSLAHADFQAGQNAYDCGDYSTAFKEWQTRCVARLSARALGEQMRTQ